MAWQRAAAWLGSGPWAPTAAGFRLLQVQRACSSASFSFRGIRPPAAVCPTPCASLCPGVHLRSSCRRPLLLRSCFSSSLCWVWKGVRLFLEECALSPFLLLCVVSLVGMDGWWSSFAACVCCILVVCCQEEKGGTEEAGRRPEHSQVTRWSLPGHSQVPRWSLAGHSQAPACGPGMPWPFCNLQPQEGLLCHTYQGISGTGALAAALAQGNEPRFSPSS